MTRVMPTLRSKVVRRPSASSASCRSTSSWRTAQPYLLEVNPRPGATLDVFDDESGQLCSRPTLPLVAAAHDASGRSRPAPAARAMAILYADRGPLTVGRHTWPDWTADRAAPGTSYPRGAAARHRVRRGADA